MLSDNPIKLNILVMTKIILAVQAHIVWGKRKVCIQNDIENGYTHETKTHLPSTNVQIMDK